MKKTPKKKKKGEQQLRKRFMKRVGKVREGKAKTDNNPSWFLAKALTHRNKRKQQKFQFRMSVCCTLFTTQKETGLVEKIFFYFFKLFIYVKYSTEVLYLLIMYGNSLNNFLIINNNLIFFFLCTLTTFVCLENLSTTLPVLKKPPQGEEEEAEEEGAKKVRSLSLSLSKSRRPM